MVKKVLNTLHKDTAPYHAFSHGIMFMYIHTLLPQLFLIMACASCMPLSWLLSLWSFELSWKLLSKQEVMDGFLNPLVLIFLTVLREVSLEGPICLSAKQKT